MIATDNTEVLKYLKAEYELVCDSNMVLVYYSVGVKDLIKYLEYPDKCGKWPFEFVLMVEDALKKIKKKYLIEYPIIENQTDEDLVLSKLLEKNNFYCFGTNTFFYGSVKVSHVIQYMKRQAVIYDWSAYFLLTVQAETKRVKEFLL